MEKQCKIDCSEKTLSFSSKEFWCLCSDKLFDYINPQTFPILDSLFFELGLQGSGLGLIGYGQELMIFHKMSPRTHHNYL